MRDLRVVVADDDAERRAGAVELIESAPDMFVAGDRLRSAPADVVVAGGGPLRTLARSGSECPIVALAGPAPIASARDALAAGARSILAWPGESDLLCSTVRGAAIPAPPRRAARIVAVAGAAGGVGTSSLAAAIARRRDAALLTFDPASPAPASAVRLRVAPRVPATSDDAVAVIGSAATDAAWLVVDAGRLGSAAAAGATQCGGVLVAVLRDGAGLPSVEPDALVCLRVRRRVSRGAVTALGREPDAVLAGRRTMPWSDDPADAAAERLWRAIEERP